MTHENTVEKKWEKIKEIYTTSTEEILGYQQKTRNAPWISNEVLALSDEREELKKINDTSKENKQKYNHITKEIQKKAKACKEKWIEDKCKEIEN